MKLGTKSVLFGAHCFFLHPFFVAWAWWRLYYFPWDIRLWLCFFLHDIGYIGKTEMDSEDGQNHPYVGARIVQKLCDRDRFGMGDAARYTWYDFCLLHSRHLAKKLDKPFSKLCVADKYASVLTPAWLYVPMTSATGEIHEYMAGSVKHYFQAKKEGKTIHPDVKAMAKYGAGMSWSSRIYWWKSFQAYIHNWVIQHKDGKEDTWTTVQKAA